MCGDESPDSVSSASDGGPSDEDGIDGEMDRHEAQSDYPQYAGNLEEDRSRRFEREVRRLARQIQHRREQPSAADLRHSRSLEIANMLLLPVLEGDFIEDVTMPAGCESDDTMIPAFLRCWLKKEYVKLHVGLIEFQQICYFDALFVIDRGDYAYVHPRAYHTPSSLTPGERQNAIPLEDVRCILNLFQRRYDTAMQMQTFTNARKTIEYRDQYPEDLPRQGNRKDIDTGGSQDDSDRSLQGDSDAERSPENAD